jgi:beta-glucosidase-like glycosyl hydrolase
MVRRILRSMFAVGIDAWQGELEVDLAAHNEISLETARQGIVLLKDDGALPLAAGKPLKIAVIGGHAQQGVPSGTGSGAVLPAGGYAAVIKIGVPGPGGDRLLQRLLLLSGVTIRTIRQERLPARPLSVPRNGKCRMETVVIVRSAFLIART